MKKEFSIKGFNKYDIIILLLLIIVVGLLLLVYSLNNNLGLMIDLFKEYCYIAPKDQLALNFTGGF